MPRQLGPSNLEEARKDLFLESSERTSGLQNHERIHFYPFKAPNLWRFVRAPWEMRTSTHTVPPAIPGLSPVESPLTIAALLGHHHHVRLLERQLVILSGFVGSKALHLRGVLEEKSRRGVRKGRHENVKEDLQGW